MKNKKYYSLKNILSYNADYNIIVGERSNGKTYACIQYALENYIKNKKQSAYLRRWKEDIKTNRCETLFKSLIENDVIKELTNNEYSNVVFYRGKWFLANYDDELKKMVADKNPFMYAFSLSDTEHDKSTQYPNIDTIIFDEFITRQYYLPDEFILFMNTISTIVRDKNDVKIFMLGNTVNKFCPYFSEMGLTKITEQLQNTIDLYKYGNDLLKNNLLVAVEYCNSLQEQKKSNKYFAFDNPKLQMITGGKWELELYPHLPIGLKIKNSDIKFRFFILFNNKKVTGNIIETGKQLFIFFHWCTSEIKIDDKKNLIYSLYINGLPNWHSNIFSRQSTIDNKIANMFLMKKVFYQSNDIGEFVKNYINASSKII